MSLTDHIGQFSRPIITSNIFQANFNVPTVGKYDFGIAANTGQVITRLFTGTIYLIDRVSISGNIWEGDYLEALEVLPLLKLRVSQSGEIAYEKPLPVVNYIDDGDFQTWIHSDKGDENLIADLTGLLDQTAALVGKQFVRLNVSFTIYGIESTTFNVYFRKGYGADIGASIAGER